MQCGPESNHLSIMCKVGWWTSYNHTVHLQVDRGAELFASIDGVVTKLLLDTEDLVQLGQTLGTGRSTGLDLARAETDSDIGNGDILSLTGTVGNHDTPVVGVGVLGSLDGLGKGTDLVDLEKKGVASLGLDGLLDTQRVGDGQVITVGFMLIWFEYDTEWKSITYPTIWKSEVL